MLKTALQLTTLIALIIFLILMAMGMMWELALMRTSIAYLGLLIIFYLCILVITIVRGRTKKSEKYSDS
jgi:membrane protein implicated in regulation of membrane protease activity